MLVATNYEKTFVDSIKMQSLRRLVNQDQQNFAIMQIILIIFVFTGKEILFSLRLNEIHHPP